MASTIIETPVTWAGAAFLGVSVNTVQWSDPITLHVDDWDGALQVSADNTGTPAAGDTCDVLVAWSTGALLGTGGIDFDTDEHAHLLGRLDTYPSNSPGEDPVRRTWDLPVSGKVALRVGVLCAQASTRPITVRARLVTHRPA